MDNTNAAILANGGALYKVMRGGDLPHFLMLSASLVLVENQKIDGNER